MTSSRLLILRHSLLDGPGHLEAYFRERNWLIEIIDTPHDALSGIDPLTADLVLSLGSGLSVYDEDLFPFIATERKFLQRRIAALRPVLGLCFGAQLIASALGARVHPAAQKEVGWYPLALTPEGAASPLKHLTPEQAPAVMHWHQDTFELPPGTQRLARSERCENQAFALGRHLLALQFHPEVTARGVEAWLAESSFTPSTRAARVAEIREGAVRWQATMQAQTQRCLDEWLAALQE